MVPGLELEGWHTLHHHFKKSFLGCLSTKWPCITASRTLQPKGMIWVIFWPWVSRRVPLVLEPSSKVILDCQIQSNFVGGSYKLRQIHCQNNFLGFLHLRWSQMVDSRKLRPIFSTDLFLKWIHRGPISSKPLSRITVDKGIQVNYSRGSCSSSS